MVGCLYECCVLHACLVPEEGVGSLVLELGMIMNHHVGAGNKTLFSVRGAASALTS